MHLVSFSLRHYTTGTMEKLFTEKPRSLALPDVDEGKEEPGFFIRAALTLGGFYSKESTNVRAVRAAQVEHISLTPH